MSEDKRIIDGQKVHSEIVKKYPLDQQPNDVEAAEFEVYGFNKIDKMYRIKSPTKELYSKQTVTRLQEKIEELEEHLKMRIEQYEFDQRRLAELKAEVERRGDRIAVYLSELKDKDDTESKLKQAEKALEQITNLDSGDLIIRDEYPDDIISIAQSALANIRKESKDEQES